MANARKLKLIVLLIITVSTFFTAVVATYTWYVNQNLVDTKSTKVDSSTTPSLFAGFPEGELNTEKYYGQTGIQYNGEDYPYILTYSPVKIIPRGLDDKERYLSAGIEGIKVILSGKDAHGQPIVETYLLSDPEGVEMLSHFTFRMNLTYYNNGVIDIETNKSYKDENGYLVDEATGTPLLLVTNHTYFFDLQIIFQSEEGYVLLRTTESDLDNSFIFPMSNQKYMFSNIRISFDFGLDELIKVNLNANEGVCGTEFLKTTGAGALILPIATRENYTFSGWYYDKNCTIPFASDSLQNSPITSSISIFAGWVAMPKVTFNHNLSGYTPTTITQYVDKGTLVAEPNAPVYGGYEFIGWSENADATYANFDSYAYDFSTAVNEDKTLYAIWRKQYTITLHVDEKGITTTEGRLTLFVDGVGTIVSTDIYNLTVLEGQSIAQYFDNTQDTYYVIESEGNRIFVHWSIEESRSGKTHSNTLAYNIDQLQNENVTLYAYYKLF